VGTCPSEAPGDVRHCTHQACRQERSIGLVCSLLPSHRPTVVLRPNKKEQKRTKKETTSVALNDNLQTKKMNRRFISRYEKGGKSTKKKKFSWICATHGSQFTLSVLYKSAVEHQALCFRQQNSRADGSQSPTAVWGSLSVISDCDSEPL
jgi:hypothetical protein